MGSAAELRLERVCRVCLQEKKDMRPLFEGLLADMLVSCASVQISNDDGLPHQLCLQCVHQVSRSYSFKQRVEQSDSQLRSYVQRNPDKAVNSKEHSVVLEESDNGRFLETLPTQTASRELSDDSAPAFYVTDNCTDVSRSDLTQDAKKTDVADSTTEILEQRCDSNDLEPKSQQNNDEAEDESYLELVTYQASISVNPGRHICNLCQREFKHERWLKMHMRMHSNWIKENCKKPPQCNICQRTFKGPGMLRLHMRTHEDRPQRQPTCTICQSVFKTKTILYRHRQTHFEEKSHRCTICDRTFISNYALKAHYARHRGEKPHTCTTCGKSFYNTTDLKVHVRLHTGEKPLSCGECGKTFRRHSTLCQHMKKHKGIRDHICNICNKAFFEISKLTAHMRVHTGERPYECSYCSRRFAQQSALIYHQRTHTGEKPYSCSVCDSRFATSSAHKNHMVVHTGVKKYPCTVCNKAFINRSELRVHMTRHSGEKLFPCTDCDQRFSTASFLAAHKRTHTGDKKHICSVCSKGYSDSASYKRHLRTHSNDELEATQVNSNSSNTSPVNKTPQTPIKNYTCNLCNKLYSQAQGLKKHMATHFQSVAVSEVGNQNIQQPVQQIATLQAQIRQNPQQTLQHSQQQQQHNQHQQHQLVQQPQQLQVQTIQIHPQHVSTHHGQPIQIHAVGVHQVQQQQVHVASSGCQIPNIVQVPSDAACLGQQITMSQIHDQADRLQFQNYPLQAVTNVLSVPGGQPAYYIVVNNANLKKDALNSDGDL